MVDWDKLGKLMRLTESEHDGEAINALRMANRMLAADNLNWSDVMGMLKVGGRIARKVVESASPVHGAGRGTARYGQRASQKRPEDTRQHRETDIPVMFGSLRAKQHDMFTMVMLAGFWEHWEKHSYLTGAQYDTLKQLYTKANSTGRAGWRFT